MDSRLELVEQQDSVLGRRSSNHEGQSTAHPVTEDGERNIAEALVQNINRGPPPA